MQTLTHPFWAGIKTAQFRANLLELGYLLFVGYHTNAVLAAFRNDAVFSYQVIKFDYQLGLRWIVNCPTPQTTLAVMHTFREIRQWGYAPRSAVWRSLSPDLALQLINQADKESEGTIGSWITESA